MTIEEAKDLLAKAVIFIERRAGKTEFATALIVVLDALENIDDFIKKERRLASANAFYIGAVAGSALMLLLQLIIK